MGLTALLLAAATPQPALPTRQQLFDTADRAVAEGRCDEALAALAKLEALPSRKPNAAVDAVLAIRKGTCLVWTGRGEEGLALVAGAARTLASLGPDYRPEVRGARLLLGRTAMNALDYDAAEVELTAALDASEGEGRVQPLLLLVQVTMFDRGSRALDHAIEAERLLAAQPDAAKESRAAALTARARVLMNRGDHAGAYAALKEAVRLAGGLSLKVNQTDIAIRSDLAMAALLTGDQEAARKYLAYTGAGRTPKAFASAAATDLPSCGGDLGLRPDDRAVVQFLIDEDGSVSGAAPIYTAGSRVVALEFARAVRTWSWRPEDAQAVPPFFRRGIRVELRCSTANERPGVLEPLRAAASAWGGVELPADGTLANSASRAREDEARLATLAVSAPARLLTLTALITNASVPVMAKSLYAAQARLLLEELGPPPAARLHIASALTSRGATFDADRESETRRALLADPAIANDPLAGGTLRLLLAAPRYREAPADADRLLAAVANDARLPQGDPIRTAALLEQADRAVRGKRMDVARAAFLNTGLDADQCALAAIPPRMTGVGGGNVFPMEAMRWGFEGWVKTEADIGADGRSINPRAVIAYPPFVFTDAGAEFMRKARWERGYSPAGGTACSGMQQNVRFWLPG